MREPAFPDHSSTTARIRALGVSIRMVYLLGIVCVGWTVYELVRMFREADSWTRGSTSAQSAAAIRRSRRSPLAAWDEQGRPIFVEDVSHRGPR